MGIRNKKREVRRRLDSKTLDAKFIHEVQHGLNCSPFEAEAVLEVVKEVYFPFLDQQSIKAPPGKSSPSAECLWETKQRKDSHSALGENVAWTNLMNVGVVGLQEPLISVTLYTSKTYLLSTTQTPTQRSDRS